MKRRRYARGHKKSVPELLRDLNRALEAIAASVNERVIDGGGALRYSVDWARHVPLGSVRELV
ncbi:MAG: hypothetical protein ACK52V_04605 [Betaproteobacteria bacterium]